MRIARGISVTNTSKPISTAIVYDADAVAFFTAASITDNTQKSAVNQLVLDLKSASIWTKMKALYPVVGGVASSHAVNLKTPGTFNLSFATGWTHSSTGMTPTNTYADTFLNENSILTLNNEHISYYSRTNSTGNFGDMGNLDVNLAGNPGINLNSKWSDGNFYPRVNDNNAGVANTGTSLGFFISNRVSSTQVRAFQNNNIKIINSNSIQKVNLTIFIGAANKVGVPEFYSNRQCAFASIGDGLTDAEASSFYTAVQNYQTTLGRQV